MDTVRHEVSPEDIGHPLEEQDPCKLTLWARVNLPQRMLKYYETLVHYDGFTRVKLKRFVDAHLPLIMGKATEYTPLGISNYPDDLSYAKRTSRKIQLKPLLPEEGWWDILGLAEYIKENTSVDVDHFEYDPLRNTGATRKTHSIYYACLHAIHDDPENSTLAFVDLFYHCLAAGSFDDVFLVKSEYWTRYCPMYTRPFTGDDLPDYFHMLFHITLKGEQAVPEFSFMNTLKKCMPFACQRRQLLDQIEKECAPGQRYCKNEAFWRVFSKIFWCCLAGTYPNSVDAPRDMRKLLRIKELCENRTLLLNALTRSTESTKAQTKEEKKRVKKDREDNCLVVFTAFRLYVLHMASYNPHYVEYANYFINWESFHEETNNMAGEIRRSNLYTEDVFQEARILLARANKAKKREVYRYRKVSCAATMLYECNQILEKVVYPSTVYYTGELQMLQKYYENFDADTLESLRMIPCVNEYFHENYGNTTTEHWKEILGKVIVTRQLYLAALERPLHIETKERILNSVIKIHPKDHLKVESLSLLMLPSYGGVKKHTICFMLKVIEMYYENVLPKAMRAVLDLIAIEDVRALAWYFSVCDAMEHFSFAPLDYHTVRDINQAMITKRYPMYTGQKLNQSVYNVVYTLCCRRVATMQGKNCFGHKDVAYDVRRNVLICNKGKNKSIEDKAAESVAVGIQTDKVKWKSERIRNKDMRLGFHDFPCNDQPVITIPLKTDMLILGKKAKKKIRLMNCPRCAGLHTFDPMRYHGDGTYCCEECAKDDLTRHQSGSVTMVYQCAYCGVGGPSGHMSGQTSKPRVRKEDVLMVMDIPSPMKPIQLIEPENQFQYLRFCHRCYTAAKHDSSNVTKKKLFENIRKRISDQMLKFEK